MDPYAFLQNGKVLISKETYAVVKASRTDDKAFVTMVDSKETTVIIDQKKLNPSIIIEIQRDWKLLTFEMVLPFELVGFLAIVAKALAEAKISIFALSSYSTDHILIKEKDLEKAKETLAHLGCQFD